MKKTLLTVILAVLMVTVLTGCELPDTNEATESIALEETTVPTPEPTSTPSPTSTPEPVPTSTLKSGIEFYADYPNIPDFGTYAGISCIDEMVSDSTKFYIYKSTDFMNAETDSKHLLSGYYRLLDREEFIPFDIDDKELVELGTVCYVGMCGDKVTSIVIGPISDEEFAVAITTDADDVPQESESEPDPIPSPSAAVTTGQRNALSKAKQYLSIMAFSHSGLISQLEFEGYTTEEATYGADNCGADWNEQAAEKAQNYVDIMPFSRQGLIDQLKFDGFTQSQAEYGVSAIGY